MAGEEQVYRNLQKHLDEQPVGYPATKSGVELRILKRLFNPDEAQLATHLSYEPCSVDHIFEKAKGTGMSLKDMEKMLDRMMKNGVIGQIERRGVRYFFNKPFVVGMYEGQVNKLTPEFLREVEEYTRAAFGRAFLSTALPQMRTIPVRASIPFDYQVTNYEHMTEIIENADGPIVILECICRKKAAMMGNQCQATTRTETCMVFGDTAKNCINSGKGRSISKIEAWEISKQNESDGLVLQPSNTQKAEFVCACCGCCCGILSIHKKLRKPVDLWATNYYAEVNADNCTGCETCLTRCQVNAITINEDRVSRINLDRCIGCGNCITTCPSEAISLLRKEKETIPPLNSENLYDIIMANKRRRNSPGGSC